MNKVIIFIFLVFVEITSTHSQNSFIVIFGKGSESKMSEQSKNRFISLLEQTRQGLALCSSKACNAQGYHALGSIYYVLGYPRDTVEYYLEKSFLEDSLWLCRASMETKSTHETNPSLGIYYAPKFSVDWWDKHQTRCKRICQECKRNKPKEVIIDSSKNISYQNALIKIGENDQKNRYVREEQAILDKQNRKALDSLFSEYGFPNLSIVSKHCQGKAWLVVHHSADCAWNEKWIDRFLSAYQSGDADIHFLDQTIKRFYEPEVGYYNGRSNTEAFIQFLKNKYPPEYGEIFGYKNFKK
jgi:hypothetical protein